jgi:hypothetical protein
METDYITPACLVLRCGDRVGNAEQCAALLDEAGWCTTIDEILDAVLAASWEERNCTNCALRVGGACLTHGYLDTRQKARYSFCYHQSAAELGGRRVNRRVVVRWARFCSSRASIHAMECHVAARAAYAARAADAAADAAAYDAARADRAADAAERMLCARELWRLVEKWGDVEAGE